MLGWYFSLQWRYCDLIGWLLLVLHDGVTWSVVLIWNNMVRLLLVVTGCYYSLQWRWYDHLFGIVLHDGVTWSVWQKKKFRRHFLPHTWLDSASLDCFARNSICFDHFDLHPLIILSTEPPDDQMMQVNMTQDNHQQSTHIDDKEMDEGQSLT